MVKSHLDAVARGMVVACVVLLCGHIHLMSVYYPGSLRMRLTRRTSYG
jgi:hypothetical protein